MDDEEFSEQPSDSDAVDEFQNSEEDKSKTKEGVLQTEVLKLFNLSESIMKVLQQAIEDKNPAILDHKNLWRKGIDFDSAVDSDALTDLKKGEIDISCWLTKNEDYQKDIQQDEPVILLEKYPVTGISLTNLRFSWDIEHNYADRFKDGNAFRLGFQAKDPDDIEDEALFYDFFISNKGDWLRTRHASASGQTQKTSELTLRDIGIARTALQILKSRLDAALFSPADS